MGRDSSSDAFASRDPVSASLESASGAYLVSGTGEYGHARLGRGSAAVALRLARKMLREGFMDVRVSTPRGRVLRANELDDLEPMRRTT